VIAPNGDVAPCPVTVETNVRANAVQSGLAKAWQVLHEHGCVACFSPCLVEQNYLFSLDPAVTILFVRRHLPRFA